MRRGYWLVSFAATAMGCAVVLAGGQAQAGARSVQQIPACAQQSTEQAALDTARHKKKSKKEIKRHEQNLARLKAECRRALDAQKRAAAAEKAKRARELEERKRAARQKAAQAQAAAEKARRDREAKAKADEARRRRDSDAQVANERRRRDLAALKNAARPRPPQAEPAPAPAPPARPVSSPGASRSPMFALLEQDRRAIGSRRGKIFGIRLGERLTLPSCPPVAAGGDASASCVQRDEAAPTVARQIADLDDVTLPREVELRLVQLSAKDCPGWVGRQCLVSVATHEGRVMGVSFITDPKRENVVVKKLEKRNETEASSTAPAVCEVGGSRRGTDRVWSTPHLTTAFLPIDGRDCKEGRVRIETRTMQRLLPRPAAPAADDG